MRTILALGLSAVMTTAAAAQSLTVDDYVQIRQVAQYYNLAYDNTIKADKGATVRRAFIPDMNFTRDGGPNWYSAQEFVDYTQNTVKPGTHHYDSNIVIVPTPEGARTFCYTIVYSVAPEGGPIKISSGGPIYMLFEKDPAGGWGIKHRYNFTSGGTKPVEVPTFPGKPIAPVLAQAKANAAGMAGGKPTVSPADYVEIEQLYGWSNIALDSGLENGGMFARTFVKDGSMQFEGKTAVGHEQLAALAKAQTPGPKRWLSNLYVEPTPTGAIGWAYILTMDGYGVHPTQAVPALKEGGLYRDELVRTPEGWRFKSRIYTPGNTVPTSVPLPSVR